MEVWLRSTEVKRHVKVFSRKDVGSGEEMSEESMHVYVVFWRKA